MRVRTRGSSVPAACSSDVLAYEAQLDFTLSPTSEEELVPRRGAVRVRRMSARYAGSVDLAGGLLIKRA